MNKILQGDAYEVLKTLPSGSIDCAVTSPPYWGLRDYGVAGQLGLEKTPSEFVDSMVKVFSEVRRTLKDEGTLWLNIGDSYASFRDSKSTPDTLRGKSAGTKVPVSNNRNPANLRLAGLKHKDLVGIPWMLAFALRSEGWYLRSDIIWAKPNPMPESVTDRPTKAHEYVFLLTKSEKYFYDSVAIKEPAIYGSTANGARPRDARTGRGRIAYEGNRTQHKQDGVGKRQYTGFNERWKNGQESFVSISETRNKRTVWTVATRSFKEAHFATFPEKLIEPMILAGCPMGGGSPRPIHGCRHHRTRCQETRQAIPRHRTESRLHRNCREAVV